VASAFPGPALRALSRIVDLRVRVGAVEKRGRQRPAQLAAELEELLAASRAGVRADADALLACASWLLNGGADEVPELHAMAVREGHVLVAAMLANDAPHRGLAPGGRLPDVSIAETRGVARYVFAREYGYYDGLQWVSPPLRADVPARSWEEVLNFFSSCAAAPTVTCVSRVRESWPAGCDRERAPHTRDCRGYPEPAKPFVPLARRPMHPIGVKRQVKQLMWHPSPLTIGRLLDGGSIALRDVVEIAARRPTTPAIVRELTSRLAWMRHQEVRAAMAMNPCTPTRVALILAATCRPRLRALAARNVHPRVRELAALLSATTPIRPSTAATTRSQRERWNS
jgi:hypothetical protein